MGVGLCVSRGTLPAHLESLSTPDTHGPLGDVIGPDVGAAGGWLLAGSGGRGQRAK